MPSGRPMSHDEFVDAFNRKFVYAKEYSILNKFTTSKGRLRVKHIPCGNTWDLSANNLRLGNQCPECSGNKHKNNEGHKTFAKFLENNKHFSTNDEYTNLKTKVSILHDKCNKYFSVSPTNLYKHGCPVCNGGVKIDHDEFIKRLFERRSDFKDKEYIVTENYVNSSTKIDVLHARCNKSWKVSPTNLMEGVCCPSCRCVGPSNKEVDIRNFIEKILPKENIIFNSRNILDDKRELDIYIPSYNLAIEYNGLYWHSDRVKLDKNYHFTKTKNCIEKDITLFHILENEWILKKDVIKSLISEFLGKNTSIRNIKLLINEISKEKSLNFLKRNSLTDNIDENSKSFGLYVGKELVFVINGFEENNTFKVENYACILNHTIKDVFLNFKYFFDKNKKSIVVKHNLRFPLPSNYLLSNIDIISILEPSYSIFKENTLVLEEGSDLIIDRIKNMKDYNSSNNFSKNLEDLHYRRIWDSGSVLFKVL